MAVGRADYLPTMADARASSVNLPGIMVTARLVNNDSYVVAMLEENGTMRVWRTAMLGSADTEQAANELLNQDPVTAALTGGGMCRYCVPACPQGL